MLEEQGERGDGDERDEELKEDMETRADSKTATEQQNDRKLRL